MYVYQIIITKEQLPLPAFLQYLEDNLEVLFSIQIWITSLDLEFEPDSEPLH